MYSHVQGPNTRHIIIIIIIIIINCKWVCTRWQWYYNTQKTQNNTYTLKTIHNKKVTNTETQTYKHNAHKITNMKFQPNKEPKVE